MFRYIFFIALLALAGCSTPACFDDGICTTSEKINGCADCLSSSAKVELSWDHDGKATTFEVYRNNDFLADTSSYYYIDELSQAEAYTYQVRALNQDQTSEFSESASITITQEDISNPRVVSDTARFQTELSFRDGSFNSLTDYLLNLEQVRVEYEVNGQGSEIILSQMISSAQTRQFEMQLIARQNPGEFLDQAQKMQSQNLPDEVSQYIEQPTQDTQQVTVIEYISEDGNISTEYILEDGRDLYLTAPLQFSSQTSIAYSGFEADGYVVADSNNVDIIDEPEPEQKTVYKVAVLPVNYQDSDRDQQFTIEELERIYQQEVEPYLHEVSHEKFAIEPVFLDWTTLPWQAGTGKCEYSFNPEDYAPILTEQGHDIFDFDVITVYDNFPSTCHTGWAGVAVVGKMEREVNGQPIEIAINHNLATLTQTKNPGAVMSSFADVTVHEFGHNLGFGHASRIHCHGNDCQFYEYGNPYDTMGSGSYATHYNAKYKNEWSWLDNVQEITQDGTYSMGRFIDGNAAIIMPNHEAAFDYYLEYRNGSGFDSGLQERNVEATNGLIITRDRFRDSKYGSVLPSLEHSTYTLQPGDTYIDESEGIQISNIIPDGDTIQFDISFLEPKCIRSEPIVNTNLFNKMVLKGIPKENVYLTISTSENTNLCGPAEYKLSAQTPEGVSISFENQTVRTIDGNYVYTSYNVSVDESLTDEYVSWQIIVTEKESQKEGSKHLGAFVLEPLTYEFIEIESISTDEESKILDVMLSNINQQTLGMESAVHISYLNKNGNHIGRSEIEDISLFLNGEQIQADKTYFDLELPANQESRFEAYVQIPDNEEITTAQITWFRNPTFADMELNYRMNLPVGDVVQPLAPPYNVKVTKLQ